ncbi:glycosyltransferase family 9 protein, partial [Caulobacter sp. HMWF009]
MSKEIKKVLVIKLGALGDFVLALAAMKKIREAHPKAKITLLTTPPFEALARLSPYFNSIETDGRPGDVGDLTKMLGRLRAARYDRVYDLQTNSRTNWYFQALRPFPPQWNGIASGCALPQRGTARLRMHTLERQADQLRAAGIWPDAPTEPGSAPPPDLSWILRRHKEPRPVAGAAAPRPYVLFVPGGSAHRPEKRWPVENFAQLGSLLKARGLDIVIIGGPQE